MSWFKPKRTLASVAHELYDGLLDGSIAIANAPASVDPEIATTPEEREETRPPVQPPSARKAKRSA